jgi:hypothetical protein
MPSWLWVFLTALLLAIAAVNVFRPTDQHSVKQPAAQSAQWSQREAGSRVVAIGDLHGDLDQANTALQLAGLIDKHQAWIGAATTLVQTGDLLDRGPQSLALVKLFEDLKEQAAATGGQALTLLGNHEMMNLMGQYHYVAKAEIAALEASQEAQDLLRRGLVSDSGKPLALGTAVWRYHMSKESEVGNALRQRSTAVVAGECGCRTLFVHAGLSLPVLNSIQAAVSASSSDPDYSELLVQALNTAMTGAVLQCADASCDRHDKQVRQLLGEAGPVWYRGHVQLAERQICKDVEQVLQALRVQQIVAGHNVMPDGRIHSLCGGRLFLIDVGMSRAYMGNMAVWVCHNGTINGLYGNGQQHTFKRGS